jgi:hypothetical protein
LLSYHILQLVNGFTNWTERFAIFCPVRKPDKRFMNWPFCANPCSFNVIKNCGSGLDTKERAQQPPSKNNRQGGIKSLALHITSRCLSCASRAGHDSGSSAWTRKCTCTNVVSGFPENQRELSSLADGLKDTKLSVIVA